MILKATIVYSQQTELYSNETKESGDKHFGITGTGWC